MAADDNILGTSASISVDQAAMDLLSARQAENQAQAEQAQQDASAPPPIAQPQPAAPARGRWDADAANQRAAARSQAAFASRPLDGVITAPPDAGSRFDPFAYDEALQAQRLARLGDTPPPGGWNAPAEPAPGFASVAGPSQIERDYPYSANVTSRVGEFGPELDARRAAGGFASVSAPPPPRAQPPPPPQYSSYEEFAQAKSDVLEDARNVYASSGRGAQIGGKAFNAEVEEAMVSQGLSEAPRRGLAAVGERLKEGFSGHGGAFAFGYSAMAVGTGVSAMERLDQGQYVTPEERATAETNAYAPAVGGLIGTAIGAAIGGAAGGMGGQFVGQAAGQILASTVGASEARDQATREAAERLTAALGEGASAVGTFKAQIEATGAPVAQLGQSLQAVGTVGTYGAGTVAGIGALTNAFQERAGEDFAAITRYSSGPLRHGLGNRVSTGAVDSGDIEAMGYDAAEDGDFAGLETLQDAARRARAKSDPTYQAEAGRLTKDSGNWLLSLRHSVRGFALGGDDPGDTIGNDQKALDDRRNALMGGPDPVADAQNALANQFVTLKSDQIVAESGIKVAQGGISLAELTGASAARLGADSAPLYAGVGAARTATQSEIGLLQGDLANPVNAVNADSIRAKIAEAQARLTGYDVTEAQQRRRVFGAEVEEEGAAFGRTIAGEQQGLTRGELGGRSFASLQGDEDRLLSSDAARAAQLRRTAANPLNSPADRDKYLAEATGLETQAIEQRYQFGLNVFQERERGVAIEGAQTGAEAQRAEVLGSPLEVYGARLGQVGAESARLGVIDARIQENIPNAERQEITLQRTQLAGDIAVGPEQARISFYDAQGGILSDTQAADRSQLSRNVAISGSSAYNGQVFADDDARVSLFRGAEAGSPIGSVQRARFGRERAGAEAARLDDLEQSQVYRETAAERTQDTAVEHSYRRAMETPFLEGPDSSPLTRGNALLGNLRGRLAGAERSLGAATDPLAREQDTEIVEGLKDRINSFERDRLYEGVLPQEIEKRIGSPGGGIGVAIAPLAAAAQGSGPYNPAFGGFGAHPNPLMTAVGGLEHEGGAMGMWWATRGGNHPGGAQGSGQAGPAAPAMAASGVPGPGGKTDELLAQAVRFLAQIAQNGRGFGQSPPMSPQAAVHNYYQDNATLR